MSCCFDFRFFSRNTSDRRSGASNPFLPLASTKPFRIGFARLGGERVAFCFGRKSPKTIAPGMTVSPTSCRRNFPAVLADRAPARTRTSLCSDMRALLARSAALLGVVQRRVFCSDGGHPWPRAKRESMPRFAPPRARDACSTGPLERGERATDQPEGWRTGSAPVRRRAMDGPSTNPGGRERTRSPWMGEGHVRGVAFSLGTFLLATQEKVARAPGGARKKTWTSWSMVDRTAMVSS